MEASVVLGAIPLAPAALLVALTSSSSGGRLVGSNAAMSSGIGIFGSGRLLAWQVSTIAAYLPLVAVPAAIQTRDSLDLGAGSVSLGTLALVSAVAGYFFAVSLVNGLLVAKALGAHWSVAALVGLAAASGLSVISGMVIYEMAEFGGVRWVIGGWALLLGMLLLNLGGPRWAASGGAVQLPEGFTL